MFRSLSKPLSSSLRFTVSRSFTNLAVPNPTANLSDDLVEVYEMASSVGKEYFADAPRWDEKKEFPVEALRSVAAQGFGGLFVGEEYGGANVSRLTSSVIFEALAAADPSTTAYLSIHNMVAGMISKHGSDEQRARFLPGLSDMSLLASYCLTEPDSGSDAAALRSTARLSDDGSHYILNGSKAFTSGGGDTDVYVVMARTDVSHSRPSGISALLVPGDSPGLTFPQATERKMGWNSQPTRTVTFEDVKLPADSAILGGEGKGFRLAMEALDGGRVSIASCSLGAAQQALAATASHVSLRRAFGKRLADMQAVQFKLADMATRTHAARLLTRDAASALDVSPGPDASNRAAMAKLFSCDECYGVIDDALQLHGGYGYLADTGVERLLRDARVHRILEGTDAVMRIVISRALLKEFME
jgi:alkylation response protein AidB-like acyl-CoA dehydrogenase